MYPVIAEHNGNSIPEIHEICKQMFLPPRQMSIGDKMVTVAGSTARLTTAEMMDYIDRVIALAGDLGCVVQTPEEAGFISNTAPPVIDHRSMKVTYPPGTLCVRCGEDKEGSTSGCQSWGRSYPRHMWNKAKLRIETQSSCMTPTLPKVGTQKRKLYDALIAANGDWVNGAISYASFICPSTIGRYGSSKTRRTL